MAIRQLLSSLPDLQRPPVFFLPLGLTRCLGTGPAPRGHGLPSFPERSDSLYGFGVCVIFPSWAPAMQWAAGSHGDCILPLEGCWPAPLSSCGKAS